VGLRIAVPRPLGVRLEASAAAPATGHPVPTTSVAASLGAEAAGDPSSAAFVITPATARPLLVSLFSLQVAPGLSFPPLPNPRPHPAQWEVVKGPCPTEGVL